MAHSLDGARIKIDRARKHIDELRQTGAAYLATQPFRLEKTTEPATGDILTVVRVVGGIPVWWSGVIGDALHNLRSALDYIACELVIASGGVVTTDTAFPFGKDAAVFEQSLKRRVPVVSQRALQLVRRLRPYNGGNRTLWQLHCLDIEDKHRAIVPAVAAWHTALFPLAARGSKPGDPFFGESLIYRVTPEYPVRDGHLLMRTQNPGQHAHLLDELNDPHFRFDIVFGPGQVVAGEPVLPVLERFYDYVARVTDLFDRHCLRSGTRVTPG
jgi:hypothetical protein